MAVRDIVELGQPVLRERARPVMAVDDRIRTLMADMLETMHAAPGIGLAAPQIGESARVVVVSVDGAEHALANPEIVWRSEEEEAAVEACLSVPCVQGMVVRPTAVTVHGLGMLGECVVVEADGLLARCLQHEIDHLDGLVFLDRVADPKVRFYAEVEDEASGETVEIARLHPIEEVYRWFNAEPRRVELPAGIRT